LKNNGSLLVPINYQQKIVTPFNSLNRFLIYYVAFIIRAVTAVLFIDRIDGSVFIQTTKDILLYKTELYFDSTLQYKFNYFPLVYLIYLPSMAFYYFIFPIKSPAFERLFLKLPLILGELFAAYLFRPINKKTMVSTLELFILFNPFILYAGSYKSQFDIFPGIFMLLAWRKKIEERPYASGIFSGIAMMMKQYSLLFSFFIWLHYVRHDKKKAYYHSLGIITVFIPVLGIGALLNPHGMIYHAILFHLGRNPNGYSLTVIIYYATLAILSFLGSFQIITTLIAQGILLVANFLLLYLLVKISIRVWNTPKNDYAGLLYNVLLGFGIFYFLNKGFLFHYLAAFFVLLTEYWRITRRKPSLRLLAWEIAFIPIIYALRIILMVPIDIKVLIGPNWFLILWIILILIHMLIIILITIIKGKNYLFYNKKVKIGYVIFLILLPLHFYGLYLTLKLQLYTP